MADYCMPPLGISSIKGYLKEHGIINVKCYDPNLEFFYYAVNTKQLRRSIQYDENRLFFSGEELTDSYRQLLLECLLNGEYLCSHIDEAISALKKEETYYKYSKYEIYSSIIERSLKLFGSRFYPTSISSAVILFQKGEDCSDAIKSYINYREQNPLIEFYHSILPLIIQDDTQYVGISVNYSGQIIPAITLAALIKKAFSRVKIIFGGSLFPAYANKISALNIFAEYSDALIIYAGEYPWNNIIEYDTLDYIPGCMRSNGHSFIHNNLPLPQIKRALPDFSDYSLQRYLVPHNILPYAMSIGCYWGKCSFCGYQSYKDICVKRYAQNDIDLGNYVFDDLYRLYKIYGVENFYFVDEAMTAWIGKIIAKRIYESGLSFHWYSEFRFDSFLNYSYLSEIKKGGCSLMFFGLESGSDKILGKMQKGTNKERISQIFDYCRELKIKTMPMFFFGFPGETYADAIETIELLQKYSDSIQHIAMGTFVLLKNIPVYQDANLFGVKIIHRNGELCLYDNYSVSNGITPLQAHDITDYVYRDKNLKRYFDYELLSRNHLLFLPLRRNDNEPCDIVEDALYSMNPSCNIFHGKFILGTGEISDRVFNYLVDASKNSFYTLSDEMSEFFEKNHYFKKSDFDIQDFSVEIFRYFINEGVIVIHEDN